MSLKILFKIVYKKCLTDRGYMISFNNNFCNDWNKKIVYAPNGFGKTTSAAKIQDWSKNNGLRPLLFTRKEISKLVSTYDSIIFFGETASNAEENKKIVENFETSLAVKRFFKTHYNSYSVDRLKKMSFFVAKSKIKSLEKFESILNFEFDTNDYFDLDKTIKLDKALDLGLYLTCQDILRNKANIKKERIYKTLDLVNEEFLDCLDFLKEFAISKEKKNCPLCGKSFRTKENLISAIEKKRRKYRILDPNNFYNLLCDTAIKIHSIYYDNLLIRNLLYTFEDNILDSVKGMISLINNYVTLCEFTFDSLCKHLGSLSVNDGENVGILKKRFISNEKKINSEKTNITNISLFTNFLINEIKTIISSDANIEFAPIPNKLAISVNYKDQEPISSLYDVLSESEVKRFSLVVLRALVKYGKYETLILDDPIDSYDDYYMLVACSYIKNVLSETKLKNWYVLTNNFTALSNLSSLLKCESIIFYYVPDDIFTTNQFKIESFKCDYKEIYTVSKSELCLLWDYLKHKLDADEDLSYVALIVTLRNIKSVIVEKYDRLLIKKAKVKKVANRYDVDASFCSDVKTIIEHYYMHFDEKVDPRLSINSHTVKVKEPILLFNKICKTDATLFSRFSSNNSSLAAFRESVAKTPFSSFSGSKIIDLIFSKICIVSYLKFEFEKMLITKLKNVFLYSLIDIQAICDEMKLRPKIELARNLSAVSGYGAEKFLKEYLEIFEKNQLLFNLFDHALEQMFPPYVATNVKDIKKFRLEIDKLNSEY